MTNGKNDMRFDDLLEMSEKLGAETGAGEDVQIKHMLSVVQAAFETYIDNTKNKHGKGIDDATVIAERYWKGRNHNVIFNAKAGNQRKTVSCLRQVITLGGWSKGGPSEPLGMINQAMGLYRDLRKNPDTAKRLMDAGNYLVNIARKMKKSDYVLDADELQEMAFKKVTDEVTVEDILTNMRKGLVKIHKGEHPAGVCSTPNIENAIKALNKELKAFALSRNTTANEVVAAEITAAADRLPEEVGA